METENGYILHGILTIHAETDNELWKPDSPLQIMCICLATNLVKVDYVAAEILEYILPIVTRQPNLANIT